MDGYVFNPVILSPTRTAVAGNDRRSATPYPAAAAAAFGRKARQRAVRSLPQNPIELYMRRRGPPTLNLTTHSSLQCTSVLKTEPTSRPSGMCQRSQRTSPFTWPTVTLHHLTAGKRSSCSLSKPPRHVRQHRHQQEYGARHLQHDGPADPT